MNRYIDADKLQETFKELHGGKRSLLIDTEPTADVRENVRGEWIYGIDEETGEKDIYPWTCSICHKKYPWQPNFCPNCGADMRGES